MALLMELVRARMPDLSLRDVMMVVRLLEQETCSRGHVEDV